MRLQLGALALLSSVSITVACGPSTPTPGGTPQPSATPAATAAASAAPSAQATSTPTAQPKPAAPKKQANIPITASKLAADVAKLGIDLKKPQPLEKIKLSTKKKLMPLFQKAMGYDSCEGCHAEGDFKKNTHNVKMARQMWNRFVVELRDAKGNGIFCDTCHNGNSHLFDRSDKDAVRKFMTDEYEKKLTRADGNDHNCQTCHGDLFEMKVFEKLWGIKK